MGFVVKAHLAVVGGLVVVWVVVQLVIVVIIFLVHLVLEIVSLGNVLNTEDVFSVVSGEALKRDKRTVGVWSALVIRIFFDELGITLDGYTWRLDRSEIGALGRVVRIEGSYDMGNHIEVHGIASHSEYFSF